MLKACVIVGMMIDANAAITLLEKRHVKGQPTHDRSHAALIAQLGEHCTGIAKVVGSNPVRSRKNLTTIKG